MKGKRGKVQESRESERKYGNKVKIRVSEGE